MLPPWTDPFAFTRWSLAVNAVVASRLARLAMGDPSAQAQISHMVSEKMLIAQRAAVAATAAMITGSTPERIAAAAFKPYGTRLAANRRRLGRSGG